MDMLGIVLAIFTEAPVTGFPDASFSVTTIVSLPRFGGLGENAVVIARSDDAPPPEQAARMSKARTERERCNVSSFQRK